MYWGIQYEALKENIKIRVIGFGSTQIEHAWLCQWLKYFINELYDHFKKIIIEEKNLELNIKVMTHMLIMLSLNTSVNTLWAFSSWSLPCFSTFCPPSDREETLLWVIDTMRFMNNSISMGINYLTFYHLLKIKSFL